MNASSGENPANGKLTPPTPTPQSIPEKFLTSWCGGMEGNKACNYNCKVCLITSGKVKLIKIEGSVFTYRIKETRGVR